MIDADMTYDMRVRDAALQHAVMSQNYAIPKSAEEVVAIAEVFEEYLHGKTPDEREFKRGHDAGYGAAMAAAGIDQEQALRRVEERAYMKGNSAGYREGVVATRKAIDAHLQEPPLEPRAFEGEPQADLEGPH